MFEFEKLRNKIELEERLAEAEKQIRKLQHDKLLLDFNEVIERIAEAEKRIITLQKCMTDINDKLEKLDTTKEWKRVYGQDKNAPE